MNGDVGAGVFQPLEADDPPMVAGYRIAARLGSGGMGKVYLSHTPGGRPVAIKVIRPEFAEDPEFRRRFRREVQAAQRVQGLYTAPVIDSDTDGPGPWLATAYVPGPTLSAAVAEHGPLPGRTILMLVAGIAEALQVIHGAGIVHRDLKPSNVLLAADGPRVIDFGIARAADATSLTASGVAIGTPAFMAPEQAAGREVSTATDIFALGQVAAYAALGAPAYGEGPSHGVLYRIVHEEPDLSGLPAELRPLVTRCLVKDPAGRASLTEILDLCRAAADQTQLRRPEDWLPGGVAAGISNREEVPAPVPPTPAPAVAPAPTAPAASPAAPVPAPAHPAGAAGAGHHVTAPGRPVTAARPHGYGPPGSFGPPQPAYVPRPAPMPVPMPMPMPMPPKQRNRTAIILVSVFGGLFLLLAGCGALLNAIGQDTSGTGASGATPTGTAKGQPRPDPKPATYNDYKLTSGYHLQFADDPLEPHDSNKDDFYYYCAFQECGFGAYEAKLARLDSGAEGSLQACRQETRFASRIPVEALNKGDAMCVKTAEGSIALVVYKGSSAKNEPSTYATLDVTVWRGAARKD
ncbi:serine/threonine-protein kinase [Streptomyces sp. ISL-94]|uniref:serine/threonine-protein kinase n=1 Tax=Streptomyces sp. ISL-94 TaxID=2819190 RepID=UPI001BE9A1BB|nr:serine/threonine-protein kinase [Streptomyces sp. ISL-94]MBT2478946.1 serine/threonine protein kinase [Streptomyces sp. ISL-94]